MSSSATVSYQLNVPVLPVTSNLYDSTIRIVARKFVTEIRYDTVHLQDVTVCGMQRFCALTQYFHCFHPMNHSRDCCINLSVLLHNACEARLLRFVGPGYPLASLCRVNAILPHSFVMISAVLLVELCRTNDTGLSDAIMHSSCFGYHLLSNCEIIRVNLQNMINGTINSACSYRSLLSY